METPISDNEMNNRKVQVHRGDGNFVYAEWKTLKVGDVVKVEKDNFFPADLILLSSSYEEAICYVETMNRDGETNLKLKQSLEATSGLQENSRFQHFTATIKCEDPNANLYTFVGSMDVEQQQHPLSPQQDVYVYPAADVLRTKDLPVVMTFLISRALGWFELAGVRHSMGPSRKSSALLDLNVKSAPITLQMTVSDGESLLGTS